MFMVARVGLVVVVEREIRRAKKEKKNNQWINMTNQQPERTYSRLFVEYSTVIMN